MRQRWLFLLFSAVIYVFHHLQPILFLLSPKHVATRCYIPTPSEGNEGVLPSRALHLPPQCPESDVPNHSPRLPPRSSTGRTSSCGTRVMEAEAERLSRTLGLPVPVPVPVPHLALDVQLQLSFPLTLPL